MSRSAAISVGFRTLRLRVGGPEPVQPSCKQRDLAWELARALLDQLDEFIEHLNLISCEFTDYVPSEHGTYAPLYLVVKIEATASPWHKVEVKRHKEVSTLEQLYRNPAHWQRFVIDAAINELADKFNNARAELEAEHQRAEARQDIIGRPKPIDLM